MGDDLAALVFARKLRHRDAGAHVAARRVDAQVHVATHACQRLRERLRRDPAISLRLGVTRNDDVIDLDSVGISRGLERTASLVGEQNIEQGVFHWVGSGFSARWVVAAKLATVKLGGDRAVCAIGSDIDEAIRSLTHSASSFPEKRDFALFRWEN